MANKSSLSDEWKDCVYEFGGALVGIGRTMVRSLKVGVDLVYDKINEEDVKKNGTGKTKQSSKKSKASEKADDIIIDDEWDEL